MSTHQSVKADERTVAVENASYRWAFTLITFALFIDVACRAWFRNEAAWDLMALAIVGGVVSTIYQARQKTMAGWAAVVMVCAAVVVGAYIAALYQFHLLH